jgi:hypothetical protein
MLQRMLNIPGKHGSAEGGPGREEPGAARPRDALRTPKPMEPSHGRAGLARKMAMKT